MSEEIKEMMILIASVIALASVWLYGAWVSRQNNKEGRESNNNFGM